MTTTTMMRQQWCGGFTACDRMRRPMSEWLWVVQPPPPPPLMNCLPRIRRLDPGHVQIRRQGKCNGGGGGCIWKEGGSWSREIASPLPQIRAIFPTGTIKTSPNPSENRQRRRHCLIKRRGGAEISFLTNTPARNPVTGYAADRRGGGGGTTRCIRQWLRRPATAADASNNTVIVVVRNPPLVWKRPVKGEIVLF